MRDKVKRWVLAASTVLVGAASTLTAVTVELDPTSSVVAQPDKPKVTIQPSVPPGAQNVGILEPFTLTATGGTITTVTLTGPGGKPVGGTLSPDRTRWTSEPLVFNAEYTATAIGTAPDGRAAEPMRTSFRTVTPANTLAVRAVRPSNGQTVGVAMPISIYFNRKVADRAAVERKLTVQTSVPTEGSFHWMSDTQVNWRPREYWQSGTSVTVLSALRGVDAGNGTFGAADHRSSFTIGRRQEAVGDVTKHTFTLFADGKPIKTMPASYGRPQYPTQYGIHVAFEKHVTKRMRSDTWGGPEEGEPGYYDEILPLAVRISGNGEFVHVNGATVGAQGRSNVSHGCVNLSPANGKFFYDWVQLGDPVNIVGSSRPLTPKDGDISDWLIPWEQYVQGSALHNQLVSDTTGTAGN